MNDLLNGAIVMGCVIVGASFLRFWSLSRDRLFAYFAVAFWLLGLNYLLLALTERASEARPYIYLIRLSAFLLIAIAVIQKNRREP